MCGFTVASFPSPEAFEDESDDGSGSANDARMMMMARPVMMRSLLDVLSLCHLRQKGGVVLR